MKIKVTEAFTNTPGGRYASEGDYSSEEFRTKILVPYIDKCLATKKKLIIDLDGGYGYGSGFLEESFGGLIRLRYNYIDILNTIEFISKEDTNTPNDIKLYILEEGKRQLKEKGEKIL